MAECRALRLFAILIGLELAAGTILKSVGGCTRAAIVETNTSGRLEYTGYDEFNCRWRFTLLKDLFSSALAIHIKKVKMDCTSGYVTFPDKDGGTEVCMREEPFCHVYARKNTWCDQEEIEQNTAMFYPECTAPKIHEEMNAMNLDFQITKGDIRIFNIEYQLFNCTPPNATTGSPITMQTTPNAADTKFPSTAQAMTATRMTNRSTSAIIRTTATIKAAGITSSLTASQAVPTSPTANKPTTPRSQHKGTTQDQVTENSATADYTYSTNITGFGQNSSGIDTGKDSANGDRQKENNEETGSDNNLWWIILLITVVSLAVLAGVIYAVVRRRKNQNPENMELSPKA